MNMKNTFQVQVARHGTITIPRELRDQSNINEGDVLTLVDLGEGVFVMSPKRSRVDKLADRLAKDWRDSGVSLESMLDALRDVRGKFKQLPGLE
jgi:bifunctional DNA-binding transcriptional regulator/antitoxin component of YhaV-PrlF toxin-antitoxin module